MRRHDITFDTQTVYSWNNATFSFHSFFLFLRKNKSQLFNWGRSQAELQSLDVWPGAPSGAAIKGAHGSNVNGFANNLQQLCCLKGIFPGISIFFFSYPYSLLILLSMPLFFVRFQFGPNSQICFEQCPNSTCHIRFINQL